MALTIDILKKDKALEGIDEQVLTRIAELSANDEQNVVESLVEDKIKERIGKLHGDYEKDFTEATGIEKKPGSGSTYDWIKAEAKKLTEKASNYDKIVGERDDLKKKIEEKIGDKDALATYKQQLQDKEDELQRLRDQYNNDVNDYKTKLEEKDQQFFDDKLNNYLRAGLAGVTFRDDLNEDDREELIAAKIAKIKKSYKPEFVEVDGKEVLQFRTESGSLLGDPENGQRPHNHVSLMQTMSKGIIKASENRGGGGSAGGPGSKGGASGLSLNAKNQVEADEQISEYLLKKGLTVFDDEYHNERLKLRQEMKVSELPVQ